MTFAVMRATASNGGLCIRTGAQRAYSWRGRSGGVSGASVGSGVRASRRPRQTKGLLAATSAAGATLLCASAAAAHADTASASGGERERPESFKAVLRPLQYVSRDVVVATLSLLAEVARADAPVAAGSDGEGATMMADLAEGEKPELIKQADAEAEKKEEKLRRPPQFPDQDTCMYARCSSIPKTTYTHISYAQFHEVRNLTSVHSFEGFRIDLAKVVTPTFYNNHTMIFPNSQIPKGLYQGALTVVGENDKFVRATMDQEMNVSSEVHMPLGLGIQGKLNMQLGKQDVVMGTASYTGETFSGLVVAGAGPLFGIAYNQALTPRLTVGGDGNFNMAQQATQLQYGFKYNTPGWAFTGCLIGAGGGHMVMAQYMRRVVPGRVTLAAEYQAALLSPENSQASVGAEFTLRQSKISASVDSAGKVDSTLEMKLLTFLPMLPVTLTLSSSLDHGEDQKATFGLGLSLGQ